jgi:hypothetical protein
MSRCGSHRLEVGIVVVVTGVLSGLYVATVLPPQVSCNKINSPAPAAFPHFPSASVAEVPSSPPQIWSVCMLLWVSLGWIYMLVVVPTSLPPSGLCACVERTVVLPPSLRCRRPWCRRLPWLHAVIQWLFRRVLRAVERSEMPPPSLHSS